MKKLFILIIVIFAPSLVIANKSSIPEKIDLIFDDKTVVLDFEKNPEFIQSEAKHYLVIKGKEFPIDLKGRLAEDMPYLKIKTVFEPEASPFRLFYFLNTQFFSPKVEESTVNISMSKNGQILFEGRPESWVNVDEVKTLQLINQAILNGTTHIRIPSKKFFSKTTVPRELKEKGIREVISIGESNFSGSPKNRKQNIRAAALKYHGKIIPKGEIFSFNNILDRVGEEGGFVKELVIKGDKLSKEYGGGVCQVSTTTFRAAFNAGLPITDRRNHSYDVPYYKPIGLDATIYLGGQDLRFKNDTPGDILIQTYTEGDSLYFVFYGTQDERRVVVEGPFISEIEEAPEKPIIIYTNDLPKGATSVVSNAHDGMKTQWIRKIIRYDEQKSETFASHYNAWPKQILKGVNSTHIPMVKEEVEEIIAETVPIIEEEVIIPDVPQKKTKRKPRTVGNRRYGKNPYVKNSQ